LKTRTLPICEKCGAIATHANLAPKGRNYLFDPSRPREEEPSYLCDIDWQTWLLSHNGVERFAWLTLESRRAKAPDILERL